MAVWVPLGIVFSGGVGEVDQASKQAKQQEKKKRTSLASPDSIPFPLSPGGDFEYCLGYPTVLCRNPLG